MYIIIKVYLSLYFSKELKLAKVRERNRETNDAGTD